MSRQPEGAGWMVPIYSTIDEEWFDTQLTFGDIDIECVLHSSCTVVSEGSV